MKTRVIAVAILSCTGWAAIAQAQDGDPDEPSGARVPHFEVAPFVGYRFGGGFDLTDPAESADLADNTTFAIALDLARDGYSQYELFYGRQETHLKDTTSLGPLGVNVEYLQLGGTLVLDDSRHFTPYMVGTLGLTRFSPEPPGTDATTRFSLSLGAGVRVPVNPHFALRFEGRGYFTFVDTDSAFFCSSDETGG